MSVLTLSSRSFHLIALERFVFVKDVSVVVADVLLVKTVLAVVEFSWLC